jgi:hypothetical protein
MEGAVGALRNGDIVCCITCLSSSEGCLKRHLDGKSYFAEEIIQVAAEVESVNRSAVAALRVLHNHN